MSEIHKFGEPRKGPKILGAVEITDRPPTVLDRTTKQEPSELTEIRVHQEVVTTDDNIRQEKREPGDPEIRVRTQPTQKEWEKIKRLEDE